MIRVENLVVRAGAFALQGVSFEIPEGAYAVLMGRTGCGKTTLLDALCGLRRPESGRIAMGGREVTWLKPAERGIGYVPQDRALFTTMSVWENLAFALRTRRWAERDIAARVEELADLLSIGHLLKRMPHGLSGGEQQRVALGRALAHHPVLLILDEPLSALDEETRQSMYGLLRQVKARASTTALHVTHSREEARELADKVLVMRDGRVEEAAGGETAEA